MRKFKKLTLTLALLLTAVTGAWAQEETLLTTITPTAKEQASYSTANVATVSFSYTANGSSAYKDDWGWWGYGWIATVTAAEGYTITKCIFYDDANRTATDSEAPFVVETTEEDKTPRINGTPIDGGNMWSKGIKKIEVYGYKSESEITEWSLTPDETGKTWTLDKMPASDVELQVEYFAESNLFLSKDALADKANIAVKAGELGVQFGEDGKSANTVTEGTPMTVTYNGTKKVLGVKVEEMAVAEGHALTSAKFGEIVCSDGKAYAAADKNILPKGVKAEALVCYVDGNGHGLALAMADVKDEKMSWDDDRGANDGKTAAEWCTGWNTSHPITGATWLLASQTQWNNMINAAGSASNLSNAFSAVGGTNLQAWSYWSSTPNHGGSAAWSYYFPSSSWQWTYLYQDYYGSYIRACLEW